MTEAEQADLDAAVVEHLKPVEPLQPVESRPDLAASWADRLPDALLHIYEQHGLVTFADGGLRLIDPNLLAPVIAFATRGDPDLDGDTWPVALGLFGAVVVWSARYGAGFWSPQTPALEMPWLIKPPVPETAQVIEMIVALPPEAVDWYDADGISIRPALDARLPPPGPGEIWGATPVPIPLEGVPAEDFEVAPAAEWLEALHTEVSTNLVDWNRPDTPDLRLVGDPWPDGMREMSR